MQVFSKSAVLSLALLAGTTMGAFAQEHPDDHHDDRAPPHAMEKKTVVHEDEHRAGPGRAAARWNRGQRFDGNRVVFRDYDRYHVRRPPPGYEWVQDGNELGSGRIE